MKFGSTPDIAEYVRKEIYPDGLEYVPLRENRVVVKVNPGDLAKVAELFVKKFEARLIHATAVDLELKGFEVLHIYDFSKLKDRLVVVVKALVDKDSPEFPSIANITWQATWAEREMKELLGVKPSGMPDPRHQFLPHEWPNPVESGSIPEGYKFDGSPTTKEMYLPLRMPIEEAYQT
ncbi:MAG: NADH-quinone oxidoreductase subunit C, partial [Candidatus Methanosuratincola sp.]|nr:NADH-quinone oxidoreductase subunit C [Candidatus Methanosuratincola sp.]